MMMMALEMLCLISVTRVLVRVNVLLSSFVYCPSLFLTIFST